MTTEWRSTKNPPDWAEGGRVELRRRDGSIVGAWIEMDEFFDGENEVPVPTVTLDDGTTVSLFDFDQWRQI
jgi:hypothetical protein